MLYVTWQPCSRQRPYSWPSLQEKSYDYLITSLEIGKYAGEKVIMVSIMRKA